MNAKRLVSCFCALAVSSASFMTGFVSAADADVTLKGAQIEAPVGSNFELAIDLADLAGDAKDGFSGCEFAITYNPAKIDKVQIEEGSVFSKTGATAEELNKAPTIGSQVTMVNKGDYNCFDYNIVAKEGGDTTVAVLWCTGLESKDNWVKNSGTLFTFKGHLTDAAVAGDEIDVKIVPITRAENNSIVFGRIDGDKDIKFNTEVVQQGKITVTDKKPPVGDVLYGDFDCSGNVRSNDLVKGRHYVIDPERFPITEQGIINGNMYYDADTDATDPIDSSDLLCLKRMLIDDLTQEECPVKVPANELEAYFQNR